MKIIKITRKQWESTSKHRPRILKCRECNRKFPDETARDKHYKDKKH